jgi:hypothetical protein
MLLTTRGVLLVPTSQAGKCTNSPALPSECPDGRIRHHETGAYICDNYVGAANSYVCGADGWNYKCDGGSRQWIRESTQCQYALNSGTVNNPGGGGGTAPQNRMNCSQIQGTNYLSDAEREWYLANCTTAGCFCLGANPKPGSAWSGQTAVACDQQPSCEVDGYYYSCHKDPANPTHGIWSDREGAC